MNSYQVSLIPLSWAVGIWRRPYKTTLAFGPVRLSVSRDVSRWKQAHVRARAAQAARCPVCGVFDIDRTDRLS